MEELIERYQPSDQRATVLKLSADVDDRYGGQTDWRNAFPMISHIIEPALDTERAFQEGDDSDEPMDDSPVHRLTGPRLWRCTSNIHQS